MVKVSVVMPVLNGGDLFKEALLSVINQSLNDIEVVVVDGGSTDGTLNIVSGFMEKDDRIRLVNSQEKSMGYQYNIGMEIATGEYIGFCEADDYLAESFIEELYSMAKECDLDYIRSDFDLFIDREERVFLRHQVLGKNEESLYDSIITPIDYPNIVYSDVNMWNGIYKKEFIFNNRIRLNESPGAAFQDMGFVIQTILHGNRVKYVSRPSYYYRQDNMMASVYNPKVLSFVNQQAEYANQYAAELVNTPIGVAIENRVIDIFLGFYRIMIKNRCDEVILQERYNEFRSLLENWIRQMDRFQIDTLAIDTHIELQFLLDNWKDFHLIESKLCNMDDAVYEALFDSIRNSKESVIVGAGRMGCGLYGLLRSNNINNIKCFCDNSENKQGKKNMRLPILSVGNAVQNYPDAVYIVAMAGNSYGTVCKQLLDCGINRAKILRGYSPGAHMAFEKKRHI